MELLNTHPIRTFTKKQAGFTMIELLMTITLVGVLSAVATVQFIDYRKDAKTAVTNKKLLEIREALAGNPDIISGGQYVKPGIILDVGGVPADLTSLHSQGAYSSYSLYEKRGWRGPYINISAPGLTTWSQDAWGTNFTYSQGARTLTSCGADAVCGNADDITVNF